MATKATTGKVSTADRLQRLLNKVNSLNLSSGGYWKAPVGTSTIRIMPPVGNMEFFFREIGQHYIEDNKPPLFCPSICTDGQERCPMCEVNEALYRAGEKDAAKKFRAGRAFYMNIIDRSSPGSGPQLWTPGTNLFGVITSLIQDPDYGDITDPETGYDLKLERQGEGKNDTKYTLRPVKRESPLGSQDEVDEWMGKAKDIDDWIKGILLPFDELAEKSGADAYFSGDSDDEGDEPEPEPKKSSNKAANSKRKAAEPEEDEDEEESTPPSATSSSAKIGQRLQERQSRAGLLKTKR